MVTGNQSFSVLIFLVLSVIISQLTLYLYEDGGNQVKRRRAFTSRRWNQIIAVVNDWNYSDYSVKVLD